MESPLPILATQDSCMMPKIVIMDSIVRMRKTLGLNENQNVLQELIDLERLIENKTLMDDTIYGYMNDTNKKQNLKQAYEASWPNAKLMEFSLDDTAHIKHMLLLVKLATVYNQVVDILIARFQNGGHSNSNSNRNRNFGSIGVTPTCSDECGIIILCLCFLPLCIACGVIYAVLAVGVGGSNEDKDNLVRDPSTYLRTLDADKKKVFLHILGHTVFREDQHAKIFIEHFEKGDITKGVQYFLRSVILGHVCVTLNKDTIKTKVNNLIREKGYRVSGGTLHQYKGKMTKRNTLEALTVVELREKCKSRRIAYSGLRKAELVAALRAGQRKK